MKVLPDGRLIQPWWHVKYGKGTWQLDPKTLKVIGTINPPPKYPEALRQPESDFEDMQVHWCDGKGSSGQPNVKYCLRWETLPPNRDRPRKGPLPEPSMLRLYPGLFSVPCKAC